ncbi:MAG: hypothetical protein AB8H86_34305 [Polyangiales bacterium]
MLRTLVPTLLLLSACSSPWTWMGEASTLASVPLECPENDIVTQQTSGFTFDSVGCGRAVRQSCRDRTCTPVGEVSPAENYSALNTRASNLHGQLAARGPEVAQACGGGAPLTLKFLIAPDGTFEHIYAESSVRDCLTGLVGRLAPGSAHVLLAHTFQ